MTKRFPETRIVPPADYRKDTNALETDDTNGRILMAAAQGIPSATGLRSRTGAFIAINCAMNAMDHLSRTIQLCDYDLTDPKIDARLAATLKADLADSWDSYTAMNISANPLDSKEAAQAAATRPHDLYAATIACAMGTDTYTACVCQGKGTIMALDEKGHILQLVPRDKLCLGRFTTTLADTDVFQRMRAAIIPQPVCALLVTTCTNQAEELFLDLLTNTISLEGAKLETGSVLLWANEQKLARLADTLKLKVRLDQAEKAQQEIKTRIQQVRSLKTELNAHKEELQKKILEIDEKQAALVDEKEQLYHEIDKLYSQYSRLTRQEKQYQHESQKQNQQRIHALMLLNNS